MVPRCTGRHDPQPATGAYDLAQARALTPLTLAPGGEISLLTKRGGYEVFYQPIEQNDARAEVPDWHLRFRDPAASRVAVQRQATGGGPAGAECGLLRQAAVRKRPARQRARALAHSAAVLAGRGCCLK